FLAAMAAAVSGSPNGLTAPTATRTRPEPTATRAATTRTRTPTTAIAGTRVAPAAAATANAEPAVALKLGCGLLAPRKRGQRRLTTSHQLRVEADALDVVARLDRQHHVDAIGHLTEHRMHAIEVRLRLEHEEELRAAGVAAGMGHGERAGLVLVRIALGLAGDAPAGSAGAVAIGAAALGDEALDHAVEGEAIIESAAGQGVPVGHRVGRRIRKQFDLDGALVGLHHAGGEALQLVGGDLVLLQRFSHGVVPSPWLVRPSGRTLTPVPNRAGA